VNAEQAQEKVRSLLGGEPWSAGTSLQVVAFDHGWLIILASDKGTLRGAPRYTVDRADGAVRAYPSNLPTLRIIEDYSEIKDLVPVIG
jgi:hypothetical protein